MPCASRSRSHLASRRSSVCAAALGVGRCLANNLVLLQLFSNLLWFAVLMGLFIAYCVEDENFDRFAVRRTKRRALGVSAAVALGVLATASTFRSVWFLFFFVCLFVCLFVCFCVACKRGFYSFIDRPDEPLFAQYQPACSTTNITSKRLS